MSYDLWRVYVLLLHINRRLFTRDVKADLNISLGNKIAFDQNVFHWPTLWSVGLIFGKGSSKWSLNSPQACNITTCSALCQSLLHYLPLRVHSDLLTYVSLNRSESLYAKIGVSQPWPTLKSWWFLPYVSTSYPVFKQMYKLCTWGLLLINVYKGCANRTIFEYLIVLSNGYP